MPQRDVVQRIYDYNQGREAERLEMKYSKWSGRWPVGW